MLTQEMMFFKILLMGEKPKTCVSKRQRQQGILSDREAKRTHTINQSE
jgi:hypothetical protein